MKISAFLMYTRDQKVGHFRCGRDRDQSDHSDDRSGVETELAAKPRGGFPLSIFAAGDLQSGVELVTRLPNSFFRTNELIA